MNELEQKATEAADRAAQALKAPDQLSSTDASTLMKEVGLCFVEIEARVVATQPRSPTRPQGKAREAIAMTGAPADLIALDAEHARLAVLADRLQAQREALARIRQTARGREACESLPGLMKNFAREVSDVETALKTLADARAKVRASVDSIHNARHLASMHGGKLPVPDMKLVGRLIQCDPQYQRQPQDFAERLGMTKTEGLSWAA